jgi:hypothetical protein
LIRDSLFGQHLVKGHETLVFVKQISVPIAAIQDQRDQSWFSSAREEADGGDDSD